MLVSLEAIQFNYDPTSATADAFNIRRNWGEVVLFPEWQQGVCFTAEDSRAAYALKPTQGQEISIQARFRSSKPGSTVRIRAIDASSPFLTGNILGTVKETEVKFGVNGESGFVTLILENVRLQSVGVGISKNIWRWQFWSTQPDRWSDFAKTAHKIYSVIDVPHKPWDQVNDPMNTQLPWTEVFDVACDWAAGARDLEQAAKLITQNVYDLGLGLVGYQGSPAVYALVNFECTRFLELLRGKIGMGKNINCSDCATIVWSFANILGCQTNQVILSPSFLTNPIILIGNSKPNGDHFTSHEVALTVKGAVFDACLQVDGDVDPKDSSKFEALLPAGLPFGLPNESHYRFRIDIANCVEPLPREPRTIGNRVSANFVKMDPTFKKVLEDRFKYNDWIVSPPPKASKWTGLSLPQEGSSQNWGKVHEHQQEFDDDTILKTTLFRSGQTERLIREDLFECQDWHVARILLLWLLGEYKSMKVERVKDPTFADVAFLATDNASVVFANAEQVVLIRSNCGEKFTLEAIGFGELFNDTPHEFVVKS